MQTYASYWLSNDNPAKGYNHGVIRIRRFRQSIDMTSQQGFYDIKWQFSGKDSAFDGDLYLHFEKMNPFLPTLGYGLNPSFGANKVQSYGRTEDSPMINALGMGGSQDRSIVLAWKKLPMMGAVKITHLELAIGHDELDEYGRSPAKSTAGTPESSVHELSDGGWRCLSPTANYYDNQDPPELLGTLPQNVHNDMVGVPCDVTREAADEVTADPDAEPPIEQADAIQAVTDPLAAEDAHGHVYTRVTKATDGTDGLDSDGKSMGFAIGIQPLAGAGMQGGLNIGSLTYNFGYERMRDGYPEGPGGIYGPTTQERVELLKVGKVKGDHDYTVHGVRWDPIKWLGLGFNYANYKAKADGDATTTNKLNEFRAAAVIWLWGPKNGALSGSKSEGGISVSPLYTVIDAKTLGGEKADAKAKNNGLAIVYNVPGGWFQIHGVWDSLGCTGADCSASKIAAVADTGKSSFNVFTLIAEYKF